MRRKVAVDDTEKSQERQSLVSLRCEWPISTEYSNDKRVLKIFRYDDLTFQDLSEPSIMYSNKSGGWKYEVAGKAWRPISNREHLARS